MTLGYRPVGRRRTLAAAAAAGACAGLIGWPGIRRVAGATLAAEAKPFSVQGLQDWVRQLASRPFEPPAAELPAVLTDLTYDQYRDIRFRRTTRCGATWD